jgi:RNA polymerase sigma factor (sigma-70 family)
LADKNMNDQEINNLAERAQSGDDDAASQVLAAIMPTIRGRVNQFRIPGYSADDLIQETLLEIWHRVLPRYDRQLGDFCGLVKVATDGRCKVLLRRETLSQKNGPQTDTISINVDHTGAHTEDAPDLASVIETYEVGSSYEHREQLHIWLSTILPKLSQVERIAYLMYIAGYGYDDIAMLASEHIGKQYSSKVVDNALTRAKGKIKKAMKETPELSIS